MSLGWLADTISDAADKLGDLLDEVAGEGEAGNDDDDEEEEEEAAGEGRGVVVTDEEVRLADSLDAEAFARYPRERLPAGEPLALRRRHAEEVLRLSPSLGALRYRLCPRSMREDEFWGVFYALVRQQRPPAAAATDTDARGTGGLRFDDDDAVLL